MAGTSQTVIPKQQFDFNSGGGTVIVQKAVPAAQWSSGLLLVRIHSHDIGTSSTVDVKVRTSAPSADEPSTDFVHTATDVASVQLDSADAAGQLHRDAFATDFGGFLEVSVVGAKGTGNCDVTISADVVMTD